MDEKEFLERLCEGIREIPKKHHSLFYALQKLSVITKKEKTFQLKVGYAIGRLDVVRKDLVFLRSFSPRHSQDFKILRPFFGLLSGDIALVKISSKGTRAKLVSLLITPFQTKLVYLEKIKEKICALSLSSTQETPVICPLKARQKALFALPPHSVLEIDCRSGEILDVLGVLEDERIDEKIVLRQYAKEENFPKLCLENAESFGKEVYAEMYPNREDLTSLPFFTIDPSDAKDHDDAIFFDSKLNVLYVAIADVSEYVSKDSSLDREAKKRGFSIYLPHKSIPMLPRNLSENICSLQEGKIRLAMVWKIELDDEANVVQSSLFEGMIKNHCNLSYDEVQSFLEGKNELREEIAKSILGFYPLAQMLRKKRLKRGYSFLSDEIKLILGDEMQLLDLEQKKEQESQHFVEEAMLLANIQSAKMMEKLPCVGIYRIHEEMKEGEFFNLLFLLQTLGMDIKLNPYELHQSIEKIQAWAKKYHRELEVDKMIIKAQNQAQYSSFNIGHFGLGFEIYTHFTSPIRRYSDLCVHRLLKESMHNTKKLDYLSQDLPTLCKTLNQLEREANRIEIDYKDRKYAHWAKAHLGEKIKVKVIDEEFPPLCLAMSRINGAKIVLKDCKKVEKFEEFEVILEEVHLANAKIYAKKYS